MSEALDSIKVVIRTRDCDAAREFYTHLLGLPVMEEWDQEEGKGFIVGFAAGGAGGFIEISEVPADSETYNEAFARPLPADKMEIQIKTGDLDGWAARLRGKWAFEGPTARPWGHRYLWLRDPDGVQVALFEGTF